MDSSYNHGLQKCACADGDRADNILGRINFTGQRGMSTHMSTHTAQTELYVEFSSLKLVKILATLILIAQSPIDIHKG